MNRLDVRNHVEDNTGRTDKTALINRAINIALAKVSMAHEWSDLLTSASVSLSVGVNAVTLATGTKRLTEARLMDGLSSSKIWVRTKEWVVKTFPDITAYSNARPRFAYLSGITLTLVPAPDAVYSGVDYTYYPQHDDVSDDSTTFSIPQADEAVIAYATYHTFKAVEKHEDAIQWLADYQDMLKDAIRTDRSSAVEHLAEPYPSERPIPEDYWLNPFIKSSP